MTPHDKPFPQRTSAAPNYRTARFQKREGAQAAAGPSPTIDLKSKLIQARFSIFRLR